MAFYKAVCHLLQIGLPDKAYKAYMPNEVNSASKGNDFSPSLTLPREGMLIGTDSKANDFNYLATEGSVNYFNYYNYWK